MANPRRYICLFLGLGMALSGLALSAELEQPSRFLSKLDGQLVTVTNPLDGSTWAAWTYRNGAETDIAVSRREAGGVWSEPHMFGMDDLVNQRRPALTVDEYGTTYLAYVGNTDRRSNRVFMTARGLDAREWTTARVVTPVGVRANAPAMMIAANRKLILGYVAGGSVVLREFSLLPPLILGSGNDGPDPFGHQSWPPLEDNTDTESDGFINGEPEDQNLEFTGPSRRGRQ